MNHIGQRIKELRIKNDLTQEKLASFLGVTYQSVSKWENGITMPDLTLVGPLTKILHVTADQLLGLRSEKTDVELEKFDRALKQFRNSEESQLSYTWAKEALMTFPNDYRYMEWLANAEYRLALEEYKNGNGNCCVEFIKEMTDNALRRYETIIENCSDLDMERKAVMGKIIVLRFCERIDEAEWSAEFEYPDADINKSDEVMKLSRAGRELLELLENEAE